MFGKKLDVLMKLLNVSNVELAKAVYIDPSYISKFRKGERKLPRNSEFLFDICDYLVSVAIEKNRLNLVKDLLACKEEKNLEEISMNMYEWLILKNSVAEIINKLIGDISEENFNTYKIEEQKILDKSIEKVETKYYYGSQGNKNCIEDVIKAVLSSKTKNNVYWNLAQSDSSNFEIENYYFKYSELTRELVKNGRDIKLIFSDKDYHIQLIILLYNMLTLFMTRRITPYLCKNKKINTVNTMVVVDGEMTALEFSNYDDLDNRVSILTNEKGIIEYNKGLLDNYIRDSVLLINVVNYEDSENYQNIYSSIYGNEGRYFLIEGYFSFYTLPEETALKIDRENPNLNFWKTYVKARKGFISMLESNGGIEIFQIQNVQKYNILFSGRVIEYTKEDFKKHILEIIRLLKKYDNYELYGSENLRENVSITINENCGLIIESYNSSNKLIQITDHNLNKQFVKYTFNKIKNAKIKGKIEVINYLESLIK